MSDIKLYCTTWCPDCHAAKRVLDEKGIAYQEIDIDEHPEVVPVIVAARGKRVVPTLEYEGSFMDGNHFQRGKFERDLEQLLGQKSE
ncbi:MAG: glutaredoxin family protein [Nitrospinota bacterium]|nr:glutaredoxin family protein [Nitrospinota bacterium]MDH5755559.1 glutaredoxin family protein [Nitrospinota bacterium]